MLASPSLMERGRSRSREPVPQLMRAGSAGRGRSVSVESRRSRCSSEGSVAEFEELAKPLNSRQVNKQSTLHVGQVKCDVSDQFKQGAERLTLLLHFFQLA